jgi:HSP20 family protein
MASRFPLRRWESLLGISPGESHIDRFFGDTFQLLDWPLNLWERPLIGEEQFLPALEVFERGGQTVVKMEVPGVEMEDIDISVVDGMLTIKGQKRYEEEIKEENYYHRETRYGSFSRVLEVPRGIDEGTISAILDNGVLELMFPKSEEKTEQKVPIKVKRARKIKK